MTEKTLDSQTKLELLKIAAQLTVADSNTHQNGCFSSQFRFEQHAFYLFQKYLTLGLQEPSVLTESET